MKRSHPVGGKSLAPWLGSLVGISSLSLRHASCAKGLQRTFPLEEKGLLGLASLSSTGRD